MFKRPAQKILVLLCLIPIFLLAQQKEITINANSLPLNKVLINLREQYNIHFSFDDMLLSKYIVSMHQGFATPDKAIKTLLKPYPLDYSYEGNVYVIYKKQDFKPKSMQKHFLKGYLKDIKTGEPLAFSHILTSDKNFISDVNGYFSGIIDQSTPVQTIISHLGYYILDTVLLIDTINIIQLTPSSVKLTEVEITGKSIDFVSQIGQQPGIMRLNSKVATHLPGYGDNSVFNLLRLQPGILASGEQTNSMIIWGSYAGQSKVMFDGFTVYGLRNFNDNISSFNPLMAQDIEVMKGGYDAKFGERAGGIVNISGITGNTKKVSGVFTINNMTINSLLEVPFKNRSSLVIAFRHTYFNLYNPTEYTIHRNDSLNGPASVNINVKPNYTFRDINIKYSGIAGKNDHYFISLYASNDIFKYSIDEPLQFRRILKNTDERNTQSGGSFFYGKEWKNNGSSKFILSFSSLRKKFSDDYRIEKKWNGEINNISKFNSVNKINEATLKVENRFPVTSHHTLEFGGGIISNKSTLQADTFNITISDLYVSAARLYGYLQDVISYGKFTVKPGGRITQAFYLKKVYFEPRISAVYKPSDSWTFSLAWGLYNQYVTRTSAIDNQGNYRYLWTVCDNKDIPVLKAMHNVAGISFLKKGYIISLEAYFKTVDGLSRYVQYKDIVAPDIYHGNSRGYGMDLMLKKDYRGSTLWMAYSYSRTEEQFDYFPNRNYRRSPQDQRHEIKLGTMINLSPFYLSANYVYGTGFPITFNNQHQIQKDYPYSRLDGSATWRFLNRKVEGEIGVSVLNILNTQNIKFSNFEKVPLNQTSSINIYAEAIPLTPTLFLKISF